MDKQDLWNALKAPTGIKPGCMNCVNRYASIHNAYCAQCNQSGTLKNWKLHESLK